MSAILCFCDHPVERWRLYGGRWTCSRCLTPPEGIALEFLDTPIPCDCHRFTAVGDPHAPRGTTPRLAYLRSLNPEHHPASRTPREEPTIQTKIHERSCCGYDQHWQLNTGGPLTCGRCHPPSETLHVSKIRWTRRPSTPHPTTLHATPSRSASSSSKTPSINQS